MQDWSDTHPCPVGYKCSESYRDGWSLHCSSPNDIPIPSLNSVPAPWPTWTHAMEPFPLAKRYMSPPALLGGGHPPGRHSLKITTQKDGNNHLQQSATYTSDSGGRMDVTTPEAIPTRETIDLSRLQPFGIPCWIYKTKPIRDKGYSGKR